MLITTFDISFFWICLSVIVKQRNPDAPVSGAVIGWSGITTRCLVGPPHPRSNVSTSSVDKMNIRLILCFVEAQGFI